MKDQTNEINHKIIELTNDYLKKTKDFMVFKITIFVMIVISIILLVTGYSLSTDEKNHPVLWISLVFLIPTIIVGSLGGIYIWKTIYPTIIIYRIIVLEKKEWRQIARRYYSVKKINSWLEKYNYNPNDNEIEIK